MHTTLYVGSLASHEDEHELVRLFSTYGTVVYAKVVIDPDFFRRYGGFAVVEMETTEETANAIRALDQWEFHGHALTVRAATAAEESAAGHPRMFTSMNMGDDTPDTPDQAPEASTATPDQELHS